MGSGGYYSWKLGTVHAAVNPKQKHYKNKGEMAGTVISPFSVSAWRETMASPFRYRLRFADRTLSCAFTFPRTAFYFRDYILGPAGDGETLWLTPEHRAIRRATSPTEHWNAYGEYKAFLGLLSDALLDYDRVLLHSVAFVWHGRAWLLSAESGTGKTTQYLNLKQLYGEEIQILCGDNPILQFGEEGITVHPSPWNGKENYHGNMAAPLTGLILLRQAKENQLTRLSPHDAAADVFRAFNTYCIGEESVHQMARLTERLLAATPVWRFENLGDLASSEMLMRLMREQEEGSA